MKHNARILHISSVHPADDNRILRKECTSLAEKYDSVHLIACTPKGTLVQESVTVTVLPQAKNRFQRMLFRPIRLMVFAIAIRARVVHFHDPELIPIGILLSLTGKKVIYDVHEDLSAQIVGKDWIPKPVRKVLPPVIRVTERLGQLFFSKIVAATPTIAKTFSERKTVVVQNFPRLDELINISDGSHKQKKRQIAYVGGITRIRGAREVFEAMDICADKTDLSLFMAGPLDTQDLADALISNKRKGYIKHVPWMDRPELMQLLSESLLGLVTFLPMPNHIDSQPNKLFEYMSAGIPVVASDFPLWRKIVGNADCGLLVDPLNPEAIAEAILWLDKHPDRAIEMGRNGRNAILQKYNWDEEAKGLLNLYNRLVNK